MGKIKGVDLLATLAADLEKTEAEAEARRQARAAQDGPKADEAIDAVFNGISQSDAKALSAWCVRFRVGPEDVVWGQILATRISVDAMQAARQAADAVQAGIGKIQGEVLAGARAAGKDVAQEIEAAGKRVTTAITQHLNAPGNGILASIMTALETGVGTGLGSAKDALRQAQAEAGQIIQSLPGEVQEAIQQSKSIAAEEFRQEAVKTLNRMEQNAMPGWLLIGGVLSLFLISLGAALANVVETGERAWWATRTHSVWVTIFTAPLGWLLIPTCGIALIEAGRGYSEFDRLRFILIWIGVSVTVLGVVLPVVLHFLAG
ncbi:hypothetical protein ACQAYK_08925 [Acidithiobacillus sp. AC3]